MGHAEQLLFSCLCSKVTVRSWVKMGIKNNFLTFLGDDASKVDSVRLVGRMIVVKCQNKDACKELKGKHGSKSLLGSSMTWSLESEV